MALTSEQRKRLQQQFFAPSARPDGQVQSRIESARRAAGRVEAPTEEAPAEEAPGFFGRLKERAGEAVTGVREAIGRTRAGEQTKAEAAAQIAGEGVGVVTETGLDALVTGGKQTLDALTLGIAGKVSDVTKRKALESESGQAGLRALTAGMDVYDAWKEKNPRAAANVEAAINISEIFALRPGTKAVTKGLRQAERAIDVAEDVARPVTEAVSTLGKARRVEKIAEEIAPVPTKKEIRRAIEEGRKVEVGRIRRLLGKGDQITPEQRVKDAASVVDRRIPDATKISDQEIATRAKEEIASISRELVPELKKVELGDQVKNDVLGSWDDVKFRQIDELEDLVLSPRQINKAHKQFEDTLLEMIDANNADDLWKAIQNYDKRVGKKVKEATSQSSDVLQAQQDIWIENRRVLREALDDVAEQIDDTNVSDAFRDMRGLYTARQNIINNARMQKGSQLWKQITKGVVGGTVLTGLGVKLID